MCCSTALFLSKPALLPCLLSSDCVQQLVREQEPTSRTSSICWHAGLACTEDSDVVLRHDLLLLAALLLPPEDSASLVTRLASLAAGLAALGSEVTQSDNVREELVRRVGESLTVLEGLGLVGGLARAVALYRVQLALLCGHNARAEVECLGLLGEPRVLRAAALLCLGAGGREEAAVAALRATVSIEAELERKQVSRFLGQLW